MWMFIGVIGLLGFIVAIVGSVIFGIKKNIIWKKWLAGAGIALVMFFTGAMLDSSNQPSNQNEPQANNSQTTTQTQQEQKTKPEQQKQQTETKETASTPEAQTNKTTTPEQTTLTPAPAETPAPAQTPAQNQTETQTQTPAQTEKKEITVYVTDTGEKYHTAGCSSLSKSKIPMSLSDAKAAGYTPCGRCNPPK
ncbi:hypothetical protein ACOBQJ_02970 [Pelotomaculum propionicicum]|uniref:hypothetical protein n=1 Tax=Pelotomaculum propionicicum TaxID=258475 RepID=UPI003B785B08